MFNKEYRLALQLEKRCETNVGATERPSKEPFYTIIKYFFKSSNYANNITLSKYNWVQKDKNFHLPVNKCSLIQTAYVCGAEEKL